MQASHFLVLFFDFILMRLFLRNVIIFLRLSAVFVIKIGVKTALA